MNENEPQPAATEPNESTAVPAITPPQVEGYTMLGELGQGETGIVWRARDNAADREVALKLLPAEVFGTTDARKRFERDSTIACQLQHPNIARLYEVTLEDGVYCYAAELVDGLPLDDYAKEAQFTATEAAWMIWMAAEAVQHAHQHGLIHGNLKPANILVTDDGEPHILDFALDRAYWDSEAAAQAAADQKMAAGLPVFLAPEALTGIREDLDSRADVYSLGALLLWLLTGESSYDEATLEPRIVDSPDAELQALLRKALHADRELRYATPGELAADIARYLQDQPLSVIPTTPGYILRKAYRRHRALIGLGAAAVVLVASLFVYSGLHNRMQRDQARIDAAKAESERVRTQQALEAARTALAQERAARVEPVKPPVPAPEVVPPTPPPATANLEGALRQVASLIAAGKLDDAENALWESPRDTRQWEWGRLLLLSNPDLYTFRTENDRYHAMTVAPDARWFVTGGNTAARLWSLDGRELLVLRGPAGPVQALAVSADGRRVAGGCGDATVHLWDTATGRAVAVAKKIPAQAVAFRADGTLLVAGGEELMLRVLDTQAMETARATLGGQATCLAFSPDRTRLVAGFVDGRVVIWSTTDARRLWDFRAHAGAATAVAFLPNGRGVASAGMNLQIRFWEIQDGRETAAWNGRGSPVEALAFNRDGTRLLTASRDRTAALWDVATGAELNMFHGHTGPLTAAAFLPDGRRVLTAGLDGSARLWRADKPDDVIACADEASCTRTFTTLTTVKDEPAHLVQRAEDGSWVVRDVVAGKQVSRLQDAEKLTTAIITTDGQRVLGARNGGLDLWDAATGKRLLGLGDVCVRALGRAANPRRIVIRTCDREILLWDAADWTLTRDEFEAQRRAALAPRRP